MDRELGMRLVATAWKPLRNWCGDRGVQLRLCLRATVAAITAIIVLLGPTSAQAGPIEGAFFRVLEVGLGGTTALAVAFLVFPARAHGLAIDAAAKMLDLMARVLPDVVAGFTRDLDEA